MLAYCHQRDASSSPMRGGAVSFSVDKCLRDSKLCCCEGLAIDMMPFTMYRLSYFDTTFIINYCWEKLNEVIGCPAREVLNIGSASNIVERLH